MGESRVLLTRAGAMLASIHQNFIAVPFARHLIGVHTATKSPPQRGASAMRGGLRP